MPVILTILGFLWWWPLGILILGLMIASGRLGWRRHPIYAGDGAMLDWDRGKESYARKWVTE